MIEQQTVLSPENQRYLLETKKKPSIHRGLCANYIYLI